MTVARRLLAVLLQHLRDLRVEREGKRVERRLVHGEGVLVVNAVHVLVEANRYA